MCLQAFNPTFNYFVAGKDFLLSIFWQDFQISGDIFLIHSTL